MVKTLQQMLE